jgi:hypothetical protein
MDVILIVGKSGADLGDPRQYSLWRTAVGIMNSVVAAAFTVPKVWL